MTTRLESHPSQPLPVPAVRDLARRLLAQGASPGFTQRVVAEVETLGRGARDAHPLDLAARVIGASFPRVVLRRPASGSVLVAVLGSHGSGRSTVVRKLALRLCGAGRRVSVLAVRQRASSKPEWLATWLSEIGAFACVVDVDQDIPRRALQGVDVVLVDGSGDSARDLALTAGLARRAEARRLVETRIGVLAADRTPERLRADTRALQAMAASASVLTRLDLAEAPAAAFEIASTAGLPVAFVSTGAGEENHLHRCGPDRAADVFLKGRIA